MGSVAAAAVTAGVPSARLAFYENEKDNSPEIREASWPEIVEALTEYEITACAPCPGGKLCAAKSGAAFSPGPPTRRCTCGDCNRQPHHRLGVNVEHVYLLVFDIDHVTRAELEAVCDRLEGLESLLYSTHSHEHGGPNDCCVRVVLPLARPLRPPEFFAVHAAVRRKYQLQWIRPGASVVAGTDPHAEDLSRIYFMPTAPVGKEPLVGYSPGGLLDIDGLLRDSSAYGVSSPPRAAPAYKATTSAPAGFPPPPVPSLPDAPVDMDALRRALKAYKPERDPSDGKIPKKELIRRVLAGESLVRADEGGAQGAKGLRRNAVHRLGSILGFVLPEATPDEAALELVRASINALPTYPEKDNALDTAAARFEAFTEAFRRGVTAEVAKAAAKEAERQAKRESQQKLVRRFNLDKRAPPRASQPPTASAPASESVSTPVGDKAPLTKDEVEGWEDNLLRNQKDEVWSVGCNAESVLEFSDAWRGKIRYNEFTKSPEFATDVPINNETDPEESITAIQYWLQHDPYRINLPRGDTMTVVRHVAKKDSYNPVQNYLLGLKWDKESRLDTWLERYCGAATIEDPDEETGKGRDISANVRRISRRWLISAVARALEPGCKADNVLILEGSQGIKKSMVFSVLAGQQWFTDSPIHIGQKDAMQIVGTKWIIEMAELSSFHGSETEQQKQFFSSRVDTFRPPFGTVPLDFPRHSVCAGTTNKRQYLNDETGNRRFWAVWCEKVLIADLKRDRDQLWAEAVQYYSAGLSCDLCKRGARSNKEERCAEHRWWNDLKEDKDLEAANKQRLRVDYADGIVAAVLKSDPDHRQAWYTMNDVCTRLLGIPPDRVGAQAVAISRALDSLGFVHKRVRQDTIRFWAWETPTELTTAPKRVVNGFIRAAKPPAPLVPVFRA